MVTLPNAGVSGFSGCYIAGAGGGYTVGQSGIGGSPAGKVSFNSTGSYNAVDGLHTGHYKETFTGSAYLGAYPGAVPRVAVDGVESGDHYHKIDTTLTMGYSQTQFIKAASQMEKFPANSILLNTIHSTIPWLTSTHTDDKLLRAGNSKAESPSNSLNIVNYGGDHRHPWNYYSPPTSIGPSFVNWNYVWLGATYTSDGITGSHVHAFSDITIIEHIKKVYTTAWTYASDFTGFGGMIAFWEGSTGSIPSGWTLCDGSNGTIDMRDHFIMMSNTSNLPIGRTGTNTIDIAPATGNLLASNNFGMGPGYPGLGYHKHWDTGMCDEPGTPGTDSWSRNFYHGTEAIDHYHPNSKGMGLSFYPQFCALYIIQKM